MAAKQPQLKNEIDVSSKILLYIYSGIQLYFQVFSQKTHLENKKIETINALNKNLLFAGKICYGMNEMMVIKLDL